MFPSSFLNVGTNSILSVISRSSRTFIETLAFHQVAVYYAGTKVTPASLNFLVASVLIAIQLEQNH